MTTANAAEWILPAPVRVSGRLPRLVAMGGDGIGREVVAAAIEAIQATGAAIEILQPLHGREAPHPFPDKTRRACDNADAVLFGAAEKVCFPILMYLRFARDTYANIRPAVSLFSPKTEVDLVIVRELTEGLYPGREGDLAELNRRWPDFRDSLGRALPPEGRFALRVMTPDATRRIARYAARLTAERARIRGREGKLTIVTKQNVLPFTDGLFRETCEEEARLAGIRCDHLFVDEAARRLVAAPRGFDVIVTSNLFGDILSDVASEAGGVGGLPAAPSAAFSDRFGYFEPVHGSGPDIAGKGVANPFGAISSAAMALHYLGCVEESARLLAAVRAAHERGACTPDMGGTANTAEVTAAVCAALAGGI